MYTCMCVFLLSCTLEVESISGGNFSVNTPIKGYSGFKNLYAGLSFLDST